jgi:hypothetical protein
MDTTHSRLSQARPAIRLRQRGKIMLAVVSLAVAALLASACDTAQQVPWPTYSLGLQQRIDSARATGNCAALQFYLTSAETLSRAHEKATGFPNDALVSYIRAAQGEAGCPEGTA